MKKLTAEDLAAKDACPDQVEIFRKLWPDGVVPSRRAIFRAAKASLDLSWYADHFLPAPAREAYNKVCDPAGEAYDKACATAREAYDKACATAGEAYDKACATTLANVMGL